MKIRLLQLIFSIGFIIFFLSEINAQKGPKYGEDSLTCIMNISLYREFYRQENFADAIGPWRKVFSKCPRGTQNTYIDGVKMFSDFIKNGKNKAVKEKLIDTLMMIYDQRIEYFNNRGYILGRKGADYFKLRPTDVQKAYNILNESVELEGNNSSYSILGYYFKSTIKLVDKELAPKELILENYDKISEIIDFNIKNDPKSAVKYENTKGYIENAFEPFASCENLISIYSDKFAENPDDVEQLNKIIKLLDKKGCHEEPLYFETNIKLYELEPSPESAFLIGKMYLKKGDYKNAAEYLEQATEMENKDKVGDVYVYLAESFRNMNNFPKARTYAYKAIEFNPENGNPYIIIGDMYATSAKDCGDNDLTKRVAYWAAVDKYEKAKKVDSSIEVIANKRIKNVSSNFPDVQTIFFHDLKEGDTYKVECWINENTIVRAAK
ncbi:MAG: tetratricopeptide repeat protein [Bacteroidales bacterium]|nr:tetratricopeptide repeat protein [Bacteroidales bacterium]